MKDIGCQQIGELEGGMYDKIHEQSKRVYGQDGLSPAIHTMGGGGQEIKIAEIGNYSPSGHDASRIVGTDGLAPTVKENHGTVTAIAEPRVVGGG